MKSIRIAIAAATLAAVSAVAFAADANANANGRDSVYATGKSITAKTLDTRYTQAVPGRQGGLSAEAKQAISGKRMTADVVNKAGRA